jgi:phosphatidate cytidylyltransferase
VSDRFDDDPRPRLPTEGVRILGAEEAEAALGARGATRSEPRRDDDVDDELAVTDGADLAEQSPLEPILDLTPEDRPEPRPHRFPDEGPTWSAAAAPDEDLAVEAIEVDAPTGELPPLPHWTEPPTGAVPAIFADAERDDADADFDVWSSAASTPRFRAEGADWAEADFERDDLTDERPRVGALAEANVVDEDEAFERDLAERRRRTPRGRAARTMVTTPPPAAAPAAAPAPARSRRPAPEADKDRPPGGPTPGRDLPTALITAAVVALVALICFTQGTFWTVLLAAVIVALGTLEFTAGLQARGFRPASALALTGAFFLPIAARQFGSDAYPVFFALMVVFSLLWFLWEITPGRPLLGVATTILAFAYVGGLGGFAGLLLASRDGVGLIVGLALCVITYDVVGFFVGSQFGKSPIAPRISPNKSFEGTLAGMVGAVLMGWLFVGGALLGGIAPWSPGKGAVLGLFVAAGAFLGDLCESMLKRDLGIKDFGSLLPGHGGVLDRFDAILFCLPIAYYLAVHLNIL